MGTVKRFFLRNYIRLQRGNQGKNGSEKRVKEVDPCPKTGAAAGGRYLYLPIPTHTAISRLP